MWFCYGWRNDSQRGSSLAANGRSEARSGLVTFALGSGREHSPAEGHFGLKERFMARSLVIVESPAKAKTINKYLGRNYTVKASYGHVMDLPRKELGINIKRGFEPTYEVSPEKTHVVEGLQKAAETAEAVYLAADPDREGEAICAHLADILKPTMAAKNGKNGPNGAGKKKKGKREGWRRGRSAPEPHFPGDVQRDHAASDSRGVRESRGDQRKSGGRAAGAPSAGPLVGYKVSPLLWNKVRRGLSAGRVQTVALRLIVEREREIRAFTPVEYWTLHAQLAAAEPPSFEAKLAKHKGEDIEVHTQAEADAIVAAVEKARWQISEVTQKEKRRHAQPPFTTSKLQQAAYNRLRYTAKRTMALAQRLYEGVELGNEGSVALITYMRTDSVRVSSDALGQARELIGTEFGANYLPEKPNFYKSKKDAQEAHEAIRPTDASRKPADVQAVSQRRPFQAVPADLAAVRGFANGAGGLRPDEHRHRGGRLHLPGHGVGDEVRGLPGGVPDFGGTRGRRRCRKRRRAQVAAGYAGRNPEARNSAARPALYRAAAALFGSDAGQGTGRQGHRAAVDVRVDHLHDRRTRVREQGPGALYADHAGRKSERAAGEELRGYFRRELHGAHGRRAGRNRRGPAALEGFGKRVLYAVRAGSGAGQGRHGVVQGRYSHGQEVRKMRTGRIARAHQPAGIFPGLLALSGLRLYRGPFAGDQAAKATRRRRPATIAAARW